MKLSAGWKMVLYLVCVVLSIQGMDLGYHLMNQKDTYLANLGLVLSFALILAVAYSLVQIMIIGGKYVEQQIEKEKQG
jgi:integral membrane sensor domain MASE1